MQTIASAPSSLSRRNVSSNAPTEGADVSGSTDDGVELAPERVDAQLLAVDVLPITEADRERHDLDAELCADRLREVARTVGHDANWHAPSSGSGLGRGQNSRSGFDPAAGPMVTRRDEVAPRLRSNPTSADSSSERSANSAST